jgi:hypothetical protein
MQEPLQGSFIWLCGAPEIPVSTENSESMQKFNDLPCPAVVSRAWSHLSRRFFHNSLVGFVVVRNWTSRSGDCGGRRRGDLQRRGRQTGRGDGDKIVRTSGGSTARNNAGIEGRLASVGECTEACGIASPSLDTGSQFDFRFFEVADAVSFRPMAKEPAPHNGLRDLRSNQAQGIAGIDMFVVAGAKFRLLYVIIILALDADIANAAGAREAATYRHFTDLSALNDHRRSDAQAGATKAAALHDSDGVTTARRSSLKKDDPLISRSELSLAVSRCHVFYDPLQAFSFSP